MALTGQLARAVAVWAGILVLAFANGALREFLLIPWLGRPAALVFSGSLLSVVVFVVTLLTIRWIAVATDGQALSVGVLWLVVTLVFEFGFGARVQHKPIPELLEAYRFEGGNLWPVVLVVICFSPFVARRLR